MHRALELLLALILLLLLSPVFILLAVLIQFSMGSPVLFRQLRPGLYGKPFIFYKFRTMQQGDDSDAIRITQVGKWLRKLSLDELPQLFNVIKGDITFVGPRPLLMEYLPLYTPEQARRHAVKPGITGWTQINGRNSLSWEEKFKLDLWYVDNKSLGLDLKILALTPLRVLQGRGVSHAGQATMHKFTGKN